ncbi:MAG: pseudouridine synthase [Betaproteobacteria bacterium]|nr:MAG: pseudouridine synthase [Betaproteobacteria bacterium]
MLVLFNKPYGVLSQFTSDGGRWQTLAPFIDLPNVYAAGRLDADSEGLLALTDNGVLQAMIAGASESRRAVHGTTGSPRTGVASRADQSRPGRVRATKTYWAQVEGVATDEHVSKLKRGVRLNDGDARATACKMLGDIAEPWPRDPPIRARQSIPTAWIELTLDEGRNRQVRRMTAAVGLPTLRLIRVAIGPWRLDGLATGAFRVIKDDAAFAALRAA